MGNGRERISGQLNEADAPVAGGVWNDAGEEPDIAAQDMEDVSDFFLISAAGVFFCRTEDYYTGLGIMAGFLSHAFLRSGS